VTAVIVDTDILSTFGKIGRLDLLQRLFDKVHMAPAVSRELSRAAQMGFICVASIQPVAIMLPLTVDEGREVERLTNLYPPTREWRDRKFCSGPDASFDLPHQ
jgi:predicted nucleic acid-binding protein